MSITWNGVSSDTIGVIVEKIPNRYVPTRRFSPQQVAGRNGNILLVDKAFPNVEQEYEVYLSAESHGLPSVARACSEWLMGPDGYCRLTDSYDTTVYREAFLMGGFDIENILNKFGRCTITFSCKPQKYLLTGDTPISIPAGSTTTYTGDVVQFDVITGASITSLSTTITPIQSLHGYSSPWPAGGGKNKINLYDIASLGTNVTEIENGYSFTVASAQYGIGISFTPLTGQYTLSCKAKNGTAKNFRLRLHYSDGTITDSAGTGTQTEFVELSVTSDGSKSVDGVRFNWSAAGSVEVVEFQLEQGTKTAYAPYSNICPISGRTGLSVYRTGKNLFDQDSVLLSIGFVKDGDAWFMQNASSAANKTVWENSAGIGGSVSLTYTYKYNSTTSQGVRFTFKYTDGTSTDNYAAGVDGYYTRTFTSNAAKTLKRITTTYGSISVSTWIKDVQIEFGSPTAYEPYNGNTYAIDWTTEAGTVYGGTLDVVTGVLTVDRANIASYNGEVINEPWLSSMDAYAVGTTPTTGAQVVYTLATPLTYQLTAQEVEALVGTNNVWSSSGDVSVTVATPLGGTVTNPTPFEARPLLTVSGVGEITINGKSIQILESVSDFEIDCETMEAEDNSKIYCMDFPELSGGENEIVGYGSITALTVTPRWWTL